MKGEIRMDYVQKFVLFILLPLFLTNIKSQGEKRSSHMKNLTQQETFLFKY